MKDLRGGHCPVLAKRAGMKPEMEQEFDPESQHGLMVRLVVECLKDKRVRKTVEDLLGIATPSTAQPELWQQVADMVDALEYELPNLEQMKGAQAVRKMLEAKATAGTTEQSR